MLAHFFTAGTTAVDYLHSHMDRFLSFGLQKTKVWELINPIHHDAFDYKFSGNANVMLKQKTSVPKVVVHQEPGDILLVPPWWSHTTKHLGYADADGIVHSASVTVHMLNAQRSFLGIGTFLFMNVFGLSDWLYASETTKASIREAHSKHTELSPKE